MSRRPSASIVANPLLIGAVTVLVVIVAVMLAYNANTGLPFVPTIQVQVQARNAAALTKGSHVREGGFRVGFVERMVPVRLRDGRAGAEIYLKLDTTVGDLPADTTFTVRPRSPLGLKYVELQRGTSTRKVQNGHTFPPAQARIPVQVDEVNRAYDKPTRAALRANTKGFGDTLAARGPALNETIAELPELFRLVESVTGNLADPETQLGRFFRELGDAARVVAPIAARQARFFTRAGQTFEAISRDTEALKQTIERTHPAFEAGIRSFPVQRPFLVDTAALAREMHGFAGELRPTLPLINDALETGIPVVRRSAPFYGELRLTLEALREVVSDPATGLALRSLIANVTALRPQLRFLGPYQTVCNYWNYFWTYLGEHVSQSSPLGSSQRVLLKSAATQAASPGSMGSAEPANGQGYNPATAPRGKPAHLHGQPYGAAVNERGEADCESGQRGYMRRLSEFTPPNFEIVGDPHTPGDQGPTYKGRDKVPAGQTFVREPETGVRHP